MIDIVAIDPSITWESIMLDGSIDGVLFYCFAN